MKSRKKIIFNGVFLAVVFALTIYGVFHGEDLSSMMDAIHRADKRWLLPGIALVAFFIWGESIIIWYMMRSSGIHLKKRTCFLFSSVGFFFSCITPSASGGQPMQIYYMKKEKISIPVSTVILMIVTITYKLVLVVIGIGNRDFRKRISSQISGRNPAGVLSGADAEYLLCHFYDHSGISSTFGKSDPDEGHEASGTVSSDEEKRGTAEKTGSFHGYLPKYCGISEE